MRWTLWIVLLIVLGLPCGALAWGPAVHLAVGSTVLLNLGLLAPAMAELIRRFRAEFLYGIVAADVTLAKNMAPAIHHCHNWSVARAMYDSATSDAGRAFCRGYQAHLASDVIAHNYFIPSSLIISYRHAAMRHTYWETRFESYIGPQVWLGSHLLRRSFGEQDELMLRSLRRTILPFGVNKQIFNSLMLLARLERWRKLVAWQASRSDVALGREDVQQYVDLSIDATLAFLIDPDSTPLLSQDPTGKESIRAARSVRRHLGWLSRRGLLKGETIEDALAEFMPPDALQHAASCSNPSLLAV